MKIRAVLLCGLLTLVACGPRIPPAEQGPGAVAPEAAVERFLRLVGDKNYVQMGWVFGTDDGPLIRRDPPPEVERRMYALARVLEHTGFEVRSQSPVPGRSGNAVQLAVMLRQRARELEVPFTAVRGPDGRWFVEQIDIEKITASPPPATR